MESLLTSHSEVMNTEYHGSFNFIDQRKAFDNFYTNQQESVQEFTSYHQHNAYVYDQQYHYSQMTSPIDVMDKANIRKETRTQHNDYSTSTIRDICLSRKHVIGAAQSISQLSQKADELTNTISSGLATTDHCGLGKAEKPPYSYIALICMALGDSLTKKCTLREIVDYIKGKFDYYRESKKLQTAIRHNLTLNDCFIKSGRRLGDTGCLWSLDSAYEDMFKHGSLQRRRYRLKEGRVDKYRRNKSKKIKQVSTMNKTSTPVRKSSTSSCNISNDSCSSDISLSPGSSINSMNSCCANMSPVSLPTSPVEANQYRLDLESIIKLPLDAFELPSIMENNSFSETPKKDIGHNVVDFSVYNFNQSTSFDIPRPEGLKDYNYVLSFDTGYFSM